MTDPSLPEVVRIASDLIRFDTSNFGGGNAKGEREAAEYVGAYLEGLGLEVEYYEPIPRRTNVMARVPGRDSSKPALVVHGHLDVVPAMAEDWSVDPFAGLVQDGMLWGRGAVDMKNMNAMILTAVADILRAGSSPSATSSWRSSPMRRTAAWRDPRWSCRTTPSGSRAPRPPSARSGATRSPSTTGARTCCRSARRPSSGSAWWPRAARVTAVVCTTTTRSRSSPRLSPPSDAPGGPSA